MERFATNAETLGYTFCWVADTQMMRSNPGVVLALAAQQTRYLTRQAEPGGSKPARGDHGAAGWGRVA